MKLLSKTPRGAMVQCDRGHEPFLTTTAQNSTWSDLRKAQIAVCPDCALEDDDVRAPDPPPGPVRLDTRGTFNMTFERDVPPERLRIRLSKGLEGTGEREILAWGLWVTKWKGPGVPQIEIFRGKPEGGAAKVLMLPLVYVESIEVLGEDGEAP